MSIVTLLIVLVAVAIACHVVRLLIPQDARMANIICAVILVLFVVWLLNAFGVIGDAYWIGPRARHG
jgi:hypothetical protein